MPHRRFSLRASVPPCLRGELSPLKRRLERVRRVADHRVAPLRPDDRDHVEAGGRLRDPVAGQVDLGHLRELVLLGLVYLFFRRRVVVGAGFHLDKNERVVIATNKINFPTAPCPKVSIEDLVAVALEKFGGEFFAARAELEMLR